MRHIFAIIALLSTSAPAAASNKSVFEWMALLALSNAECPGQNYDVSRLELISQILAAQMGWSDMKRALEWKRAIVESRKYMEEDRELFCGFGPAYLATLTPESKNDLGFVSP